MKRPEKSVTGSMTFFIEDYVSKKNLPRIATWKVSGEVKRPAKRRRLVKIPLAA